MDDRTPPQNSARCCVWRKLLLTGSILLSGLLAVGQAQVTTTLIPDGTLGTTVIRNGTVYNITGGTRPGENGPNLFHSFDRFSVGRGDTARFSGPAGIENILSRVTGGQRSDIDGRLQSTIPGANLYLLNPSGVVFGPHASLDVSGSLHVSTADYLLLADGAMFSARLGMQSTFTVAPPTAFGFLLEGSADIAVRGPTLEVPERQAVSMIGGDIRIERGAIIRAPGGHVHLTSVASPGEARVEGRAGASRLTDTMPPRLGSVRIADDAQVDVSGSRGGQILFEAGTITLTNRAVVLNGAFGVRPGSGGDIRVRANTLTLRGTSGMFSFTTSESSRNAGSIRIEVQTVTIRDGSFLISSTTGAGQGSSVTITTDTLTIRDGSIFGSDTWGAGRSGNVTVTAETLVIDGSRVIDSSSVRASQISTTSAPGSRGGVGNVRVEAQTVTLTRGGQIGSATRGAGRGGNLTVIAQDTVLVDGFGMGLPGQGEEGVEPSLIATSSQPGSTGNAGNMRVEARTVILTNGAQMQSGTVGAGRGGNLTVIAQDAVLVDGFGGGLLSLITANTEAIGDAGSVRVEAQTVTATNGAQISSVTFGAGQGGSVTVMAHDHVTFRGTSPEGEALRGVLIPGDRIFPSGAFVNSHGAGAPGVVQVTAPRITLAAGGRISSLNIASAEAGGTVIVRASDTLEISGVGSSLRTRSFGPGQGRDIDIDAGTVILKEGADLSAASIPTDDAQGSGDAGNVTVTVSKQLLLQNSFVTTEATQADGGDITLRVQDLIRLRDSQITTAVRSGEGAGGNIVLDTAAEFVVLQNSQIVANAFGGPGGNISIRTGVFLTDPGSQVSASSALGIDGQIDIQAPVTNLSGVVAPLSPDFAQATALLRDRCAARLREGTVSSLVVRARPSLPATYDGLLPGRLYEPKRQQATPAGVAHQPQKPSVTQQGHLRIDSVGGVHSMIKFFVLDGLLR